MGRVREEKRRERKRKKIKEEKVRRKKMQVREKVRKSRNTIYVFPIIRGSGGSKSRLAKAAGAEASGQIRDEKLHAICGAKHISKSKCTKHFSFRALLECEMSKKCTLLWRKAYLQVKLLKTLHVRSTFGS